MSSIARRKWLVLIIIIVLFIAFDAMVDNVSIVDRGIAIGLAVDLENDQIRMTAQFILPKNGGVSAGTNNFATYTAIGTTVNEAIGNIGKKLGSQVSLSHTITLLINKSIFERGKADIIEYFLTDDELPDTCFLAATESVAGDFLDVSVPFAEVPSYILQRLFRPARANIGIAPVTLKDFFVRYYAKHPGIYLPIIYTETGKPSSDQSANGLTEVEIFKADKALICNKESAVATLSQDAVKGLSLLNEKITDGTVTIAGRDGKTASIKIIESSGSTSYDLDKNTVEVKLKIKAMRVAGVKEEGENKALEFKMDEYEIEEFKERISRYVNAAFEESKRQNIDLFMVYRGFFRSNGEKWLKEKAENYLDPISLVVSASVTER